MNNVFAGAFSQLLTMSPILLVYLAGIVLALVNWQHHPSPARFVLFASLLLLVVSVGQAFVFQYLVFERVERGWTVAQSGVALAAMGTITSLLHAGGLCLLLAAAFVGRRSAKAALAG